MPTTLPPQPTPRPLSSPEPDVPDLPVPEPEPDVPAGPVSVPGEDGEPAAFPPVPAI